MRTEVHVHGTAYICKGVSVSDIERALGPWLEYLDVEAIGEAKSLEPEEPGIEFDARERALDICWTGEVGRSFHDTIAQTFQALGRLTESASAIELTYYHQNGDDEMQLLFVGPTPKAIHDAQRQLMIEDVEAVLGRHFGKPDIERVLGSVNELFDKDWTQKEASGETENVSLESLPMPRGKHLH